jgi:hypothetical protein
MTRRPLRSAGRPEPKPDPRGVRRGGHRLRRAAPGAWQGPSLYVWDEDEAEAERWARTLAQVLPAREEAR